MRAIESAPAAVGDRDRVEDLLVAQGEPVAGTGPAAGLLARGARPPPPTSSSTSAPLVTSVAAPVRISWCTPCDGALVTGPGTPISDRLRRPAQLAVLSAPLRTAASTTTVPRVSAAISRLRARKRSRVGEHPAATSDTTAPCRAEVVEQRLVRHRVGAVHPAGEHRHGRPPTASAPRWAAWSMPKAAPETTG